MSRPLKMFMRGKRITMLQEILRRMGYPMHDQSGQFGASTRDGVKAFQRQHDLKPTGSVDAELLSMMQQGSGAKPSTNETAPIEETPIKMPANQQQLDALILLLIDKDIITEEELNTQISRPKPIQITQAPLVS